MLILEPDGRMVTQPLPRTRWWPRARWMGRWWRTQWRTLEHR